MTNKEKLQKEVQKRLNDPNWEKDIGKAIIQKLHPIKKVKQYVFSLAAALIFVSLSVIYFGKSLNSIDSVTIDDDIYLDLMSEMVVDEELMDYF